MNDNPTLEQLLEVEEHFGLQGPALVEKDWYVVKALKDPVHSREAVRPILVSFESEIF